MSKFRLALAGYVLLMAVLVDFASKWLSMLADASFILAAAWALWPLAKRTWQDRS